MHLDNFTPNPWSILPFGVLLATMALAPLVAPGWWHRHYPKVAVGLGAVTVIYYLAVLHAAATVGHAVHEYIGFVALVGGLFVVSGGIHIGIKGQGRPGVNAGFLLAGAVLANVLGTTGAAMLLIRPWIRLNQTRIRAYHIVFFIFIVANAGGCLTPIGDPPLFLGYLQGVPFWWVIKNCWLMWAVGVGLLLGIFYGVDAWHFRQMGRRSVTPVTWPAKPSGKSDSVLPCDVGAAAEDSRAPGQSSDAARQPWRLKGCANFLFLGMMLGAVFVEHPFFLREGLMVTAAVGSWLTTKKSVHEANGFNFHPLREVAILFAGIFATMMPALDWLQFHAAEVFGHAPAPAIFFWGTGLLSSVLDNAPTYLAFFSSLKGVADVSDTAVLLQQHAASLAGISVGAVFFGAATYIGNGPNFMIKAMADQEKIPMPSFVNLVWQYSVPILLPVLVVLWLLFLRS